MQDGRCLCDGLLWPPQIVLLLLCNRVGQLQNVICSSLNNGLAPVTQLSDMSDMDACLAGCCMLDFSLCLYEYTQVCRCDQTRWTVMICQHGLAHLCNGPNDSG